MDNVFITNQDRIFAPNKDVVNACRQGDVKALEEALKEGGNPNFISPNHQDEGSNVLTLAAKTNGSECTKVLLRHGALPTVKMLSNKNTALHEAANVGNDEACALLLEQDLLSKVEKSQEEEFLPIRESKNLYGNTPLFAACRSGSVQTVKILLDHNADVNAKNHLGSSVLHLCAFLTKKTETSSKLVANPAEERRSSKLNDVEPHLQIAAMILTYGNFDNIDTVDENGYSPLHISSQRGSKQMCKLLVDWGASIALKTPIDSKGRGHRNSIQTAQHAGMNETAELLKELQSIKEKTPYLVVTKNLAKNLSNGVSNMQGSTQERRNSYTKCKKEQCLD